MNLCELIKNSHSRTVLNQDVSCSTALSAVKFEVVIGTKLVEAKLYSQRNQKIHFLLRGTQNGPGIHFRSFCRKVKNWYDLNTIFKLKISEKIFWTVLMRFEIIFRFSAHFLPNPAFSKNYNFIISRRFWPNPNKICIFSDLVSDEPLSIFRILSVLS